MEQGRELPIDKFIKIVYIYKGKLKLENNSTISKAMKNPKHSLGELSVEELKGMLPEAEIHAKADQRNQT